MYKIVAIDIDDTLLNDDLQVTKDTRKAILAAMEQGVIVTLATGRMYASAQKIAEQLDMNVPLITYHGSLVKNSSDGKIWYERYMPETAIMQVFHYTQERGYHLQGFWNDQLYAPTDNEKLRAYSQLANVPFHIEPNFEKLLHKPMPKMIIIDEPSVLDKIAEEIQPLLGSQVHVTKSKPHYLEFTHAEGTKGQALTNVAAKLNCDLSQVIAIGDSWNDHDMIETAGLGVAMANSVPSLKEVADYVTLSNNEEGVKHVIEKFVLNNATQ